MCHLFALLHVMCRLLALLRMVCTATRGVHCLAWCTAACGMPFTCTATCGAHCCMSCALLHATCFVCICSAWLPHTWRAAFQFQALRVMILICMMDTDCLSSAAEECAQCPVPSWLLSFRKAFIAAFLFAPFLPLLLFSALLPS